MKKNQSKLTWAVMGMILLGAATSAGCGDGDPVANVSYCGTIKLDGQPLDQGTASFSVVYVFQGANKTQAYNDIAIQPGGLACFSGHNWSFVSLDDFRNAIQNVSVSVQIDDSTGGSINYVANESKPSDSYDDSSQSYKRTAEFNLHKPNTGVKQPTGGSQDESGQVVGMLKLFNSGDQVKRIKHEARSERAISLKSDLPAGEPRAKKVEAGIAG